MNSDKAWITGIRIVFYGLAIVSLLCPFAVLFVIDPEDPNHIRTFTACTFLAGVLAIVGKLLSMAIEVLRVYIDRNRTPQDH